MQHGDAPTSWVFFFFLFKTKSPISLMSYRLVELDPEVDVFYFSSLCLSEN